MQMSDQFSISAYAVSVEAIICIEIGRSDVIARILKYAMSKKLIDKPITDIIEEQWNVTQVTKFSKRTFKEYQEKNRQIDPSNTVTSGAAKSKVDFIWEPIEKGTSKRVSSASPESLPRRK